MSALLGPSSPCEVKVTPGTEGGLDIEVFVPTYDGGATFSITVERDNDGDWRVFLPWIADLNDQEVILSDGHAVLNGIAYLGAPDVPRERTDNAEDGSTSSCEGCLGTGWRLGGSGRTTPPPGGTLVQRCDACGKFDGDLAAAQEYALLHGGQVGAIRSVCLPDEPLMAPGSDPWVVAGAPRWAEGVHSVPGGHVAVSDGVAWVSQNLAIAFEMFHPTKEGG